MLLIEYKIRAEIGEKKTLNDIDKVVSLYL